MGILDIVIVLWFIIDIIDGYRKGFIAMVISIASIFIGIYAAKQFSDVTLDLLDLQTVYANEIAQAVTFIIVIIALILLSRLLSKFALIIGLGTLNSIGGLFMGFVRSVLLLGILALLFSNINKEAGFVSNKKLEESKFYGSLLASANIIFPYLKDYNAKNSFEDMIEDATDKVEDAVEDATDKVEDAVEDATDKFKDIDKKKHKIEW